MATTEAEGGHGNCVLADGPTRNHSQVIPTNAVPELSRLTAEVCKDEDNNYDDPFAEDNDEDEQATSGRH